MTREEKLELIAKDQGWLPHPVTGLFYSLEDRLAGMRAETGVIEHIPDYFGCLNACRKMEEAKLTEEQCQAMNDLLWDAMGGKKFLWQATAEQRAEAYGLARGLWKEGE